MYAKADAAVHTSGLSVPQSLDALLKALPA
jgi:hypothetical protein